MAARRPGFREHVLASRLQTLEDVTLAEMATVAVLAGDEDAAPLVAGLQTSALVNGFAFATTSLAENGLHDLHAVVGALARSLEVRGARRPGLSAAFDVFVARHGRRAEERFEEHADAEGLAGELRTLGRDCIAAALGTGATRKLHAWLGGRDVTLRREELRPLSHRTAKRALVAFTKLVRALGHRGLRVVLTETEALIDLPTARRDVAYTVLREIVDNGDGRGMVACEILFVGTGDLDRRVHSLLEHPALATRVVADVAPGPPIPHQTWVTLTDSGTELPPLPEIDTKSERHAASLRALVRLLQGLPPIEAVPELTIGMEEVDRRIEQLFETASNDGSVFAVLTGAYGAGKTHHLLHLEARALADRRPVLRLAVERLDEDLGNPQRHLRRLIENAVAPGRKPTDFLERLETWLEKPASRKRLTEALRAIAESDSDAARAALEALGPDDEIDDDHVVGILGALDLVEKPNAAAYRKDAYARLQLWVELLARLEACEGPVVILDEAENLYRAGVSRSVRRTALRSLAHYCGGAIPRATVVLAVTPDTLEALRGEASELLDEIEEQATLLASEDVAMLRRRLLRARPIHVTRLDRADLELLAHRAQKLARTVLGRRRTADDEALSLLLRRCDTPRELLRAVLHEEQRRAWLD